MALFVDGPPAAIEDLSAYDSQLLNVANGEGIDVSQKLRLAYEEIGMEIYTVLSRMHCADPMLWMAAKPNPAIVAVTPPLKLWHVYRSLEMVYADAYNSQLNDRYAGKRDRYREQARWAHEKLVQNGLGIVQLPVAKASTPVIAAAPGAVADGTYYITMAWVNRAGEEGASAAAALATTGGNSFAVQPAGPAPVNATGWNVYVGSSPETMTRQNATALANGSTWTQPSLVVTTGATPGNGQEPTYSQPIPRVLERG